MNVPPADQNLNLGDKKTKDLVENLKASLVDTTVKVSGTAKKITGWAAFSSDGEEQNGHYVPLVLPTECVSKEITIKGRKEEKGGDRTVTIDPDRLLITRMENLENEKSFEIYKDGKLYLTVDLSGVEKSEEPIRTSKKAIKR